MALRLILLVIAVIALVGVFGGLVPSGNMLDIVQTIQAPLLTVAYAGEINQLSSLFEEFIELRENRNSKNAEKMAEKLDKKINNLQLVKMFCNEEISTLELVFEHNPYKKLQQICPELKNISMSKAAQLFSQI